MSFSTYYLLDSPNASLSPIRPALRTSSSVSTSAFSPVKKINFSPVKQLEKFSFQKRNSGDPSTEPSRRITEPESEIKKFVDNGKKGNKKSHRQGKSFDASCLKVLKCRKNEKSKKVDEKTEKFEKNQDYIVKNLKIELDRLKAELAVSQQKLKKLQECKN
jgi:hypothetical protein